MHGQLFTSDFLREGIRETPGWTEAESEFVEFRRAVERVFSVVSRETVLNESQTEDEIIVPVLRALGWSDFLSQQTANRRGREDVPDFLLFASADAKRQAVSERQPDRRYRHGKLIVEAKRWQRPLDRGDATDSFDAGTPSSQMLRYLSRSEVASDRAIQWGILTNGSTWRLYWQSARSRSEEFLHFDLAELAGVASISADMFAPADPEQVHYLRAFYLLFRRAAFLPQPGDGEGRSFHALALDAGRFWETMVSQSLGGHVFNELFPKLAAAIVHHDPEAQRPYARSYLDEVHRASLILLYRLLFVLFAEDRHLLPVADKRYDDYSLTWLRRDIARRIHEGDAFSATATRAWQHLRSLFRAIDAGDDSIGLPPYNGGLFHESPNEILARTELPDAELAPLIDGLSRRADLSGRAFINYRDLAVQHLGSIYERLLEQRLVEGPDGRILVQLSVFARKNTGSYYTHDDLVKLILQQTLEPLVNERIVAFGKVLDELKQRSDELPWEEIHHRLADTDPVEAILALRVCDPAMGSGHFLVSLVDDLTDKVLEQLADTHAKSVAAGFDYYHSPVVAEIIALRERITRRAQTNKWPIDLTLLDDRHLVRRMILKRVVHGVDKNPMAVELAKLALWLDTFTVGAPLSFLDHHLRCGDSLYGERLADVRTDLNKLGALFSDSHMASMLLAARTMHEIGALSDVDLVEVERSRELASAAFSALDGLRRVLDFWQALRWIAPLDAPQAQRSDKHASATELLSGRYRLTLLELLAMPRVQSDDPNVDERVNSLLDECRALAERERFLHWELSFPAVWEDAGTRGVGGFDAVIGNPPWDRIKLQQIEWFAERRPDISKQARASDRKRMIAALIRNNDPLATDYRLANKRAEDVARVARRSGMYPLLSGGDINLYSLFVERASHIVDPTGIVGLLTPSGIAADKSAARFFRSIATNGRLGGLFDFENRKIFFPDIHASFKFCAIVFGASHRHFVESRCAFYLHSTAELKVDRVAHADDETHLASSRVVSLSADDFRVVNPNTGTAPIFRNRRDAALTTRIYRSHQILVRHIFAERKDPVSGERVPDVDKIARKERLYPVEYSGMFHMTNESELFKRSDELEAEGWYPVENQRWRKGADEMLQLYEGKMVQLYDHRAASVVVNPENIHRPAVPKSSSVEEHENPEWLPRPQFWVARSDVAAKGPAMRWSVAFKDVTATTNIRTMIGAIVPEAGFGNTLPAILPLPGKGEAYREFGPLLLANMNSLIYDYLARQKVQGQHLNWFIVEQLPVVAAERYEERLGSATAAEFVRGEVLRLSYTANDLAPFAQDLGYDGSPFVWDAEDRYHRLARLDALYFRLYGLDRSEATYVLDTFSILQQQDEARFNRYRTKDLVLGYMNALSAGDTSTVLAL